MPTGAETMTTPDDETMWQANPWHKMYPQRYEEAVAEAAGTLAGTCMGMGEEGPQWTDPFHRGFRAAVACAFDRGFESARREDHDCVAVAEVEARVVAATRSRVAADLRAALVAGARPPWAEPGQPWPPVAQSVAEWAAQIAEGPHREGGDDADHH